MANMAVNSHKGMNLLVGDKWEEYFDVIIVEARKPRFFTDESCPLRIYDKQSHTNLWKKVNSLHKGNIYYQVINFLYYCVKFFVL